MNILDLRANSDIGREHCKLVTSMSLYTNAQILFVALASVASANYSRKSCSKAFGSNQHIS
jgi:hypothetical protein